MKSFKIKRERESLNGDMGFRWGKSDKILRTQLVNMKRALQNMISEQQNEVVGKVGKNGLVRIGFGNLSGGGRDFSGKKIWLKI